MSIIRILVCVNLLLNLDGYSQEAMPVFISGNEGHESYRTPAIICSEGNILLAFAEGRVHGSGDFVYINIVMK